MPISTPMAASVQGRRSADEWRTLIRAFTGSGETRKEFCARHGVALSTFDWWRSRLRREPPRAVSRAPLSHGDALFVELAQEAKPAPATSPAWDVELELGRGVFLRLRRAPC